MLYSIELRFFGPKGSRKTKWEVRLSRNLGKLPREECDSHIVEPSLMIIVQDSQTHRSSRIEAWLKDGCAALVISPPQADLTVVPSQARVIALVGFDDLGLGGIRVARLLALARAGQAGDLPALLELRLDDGARPEGVAALERQAVVEDVQDPHAGPLCHGKLNAASTARW